MDYNAGLSHTLTRRESGVSRGLVIFSGNNGKDTTMAKPKKRVEWAVRLHRYNLKEGNNLHPRVVLRGTLSLEDLAQRVERSTRGLYKAEETIIVAHKLMEAAIDALVEGYALNTSLGRLTPVVTGMWSVARLSPEARALNKASVSYALSRELKEAFSDPLFHDEVPPDTGPGIYLVHDMESNSDNGRITPGGYLWVKGRHLLMNGDSPERGVELLARILTLKDGNPDPTVKIFATPNLEAMAIDDSWRCVYIGGWTCVNNNINLLQRAGRGALYLPDGRILEGQWYGDRIPPESFVTVYAPAVPERFPHPASRRSSPRPGPDVGGPAFRPTVPLPGAPTLHRRRALRPLRQVPPPRPSAPRGPRPAATGSAAGVPSVPYHGRPP